MRSIGTLLFLATLATTTEAQTYYNPNTNYANPDSTMTQQWLRRGCVDPWVALALNNVFGRVDSSRCGTVLYNGGHWNDFNQLVHAVAQTRSALDAQGISTRLVKVNGAVMVGFYKGGAIVAAGGGNLIGHDGATLVGDGGGTLRGREARFTPAGYRLLANDMSIRLPVGQIVY